MDQVGSMLWGGVEGQVWRRRDTEGRGSSEGGGQWGLLQRLVEKWLSGWIREGEIIQWLKH